MKLNYRILERIITTALEEDKVNNDITSNYFCSPNEIVKGVIKVSDEGIICGIPVVQKLYSMVNGNIKFLPKVKEGDYISNEVVAEINGNSKSLLSTERVVLNFLSHLSGVASLTSEFVKRVKKYDVKIMDTRKTLPGLKHLEKYAVSVGGGSNHRMNLNEMILVKDNHIKIASKKNTKIKYKTIVDEIRKEYPDKKIEIEVENLEQFRKVSFSCPDIIMLDNMKLKEIKKVVELKQKFQKEEKKIKNTQLEVSGGINLNTVEDYANCGINRISIGSLTNSTSAIDFSMEIV